MNDRQRRWEMMARQEADGAALEAIIGPGLDKATFLFVAVVLVGWCVDQVLFVLQDWYHASVHWFSIASRFVSAFF